MNSWSGLSERSPGVLVEVEGLIWWCYHFFSGLATLQPFCQTVLGRGKDVTRIKCFGVSQHLPASTSEHSHTTGSSSWVPMEEERELPGSPVLPQTGWLSQTGWRLWYSKGCWRLAVIYVTDRLQFPFSVLRNLESCVLFNWPLWLQQG